MNPELLDKLEVKHRVDKIIEAKGLTHIKTTNVVMSSFRNPINLFDRFINSEYHKQYRNVIIKPNVGGGHGQGVIAFERLNDVELRLWNGDIVNHQYVRLYLNNWLQDGRRWIVEEIVSQLPDNDTFRHVLPYNTIIMCRLWFFNGQFVFAGMHVPHTKGNGIMLFRNKTPFAYFTEEGLLYYSLDHKYPEMGFMNFEHERHFFECECHKFSIAGISCEKIDQIAVIVKEMKLRYLQRVDVTIDSEGKFVIIEMEVAPKPPTVVGCLPTLCGFFRKRFAC